MSGDISGWITAGVAIATFLLGGIGAYAGHRVASAELRFKVVMLTRSVKRLREELKEENDKNHAFRGQMTRGYIMVQQCCDELGLRWPEAR